MEVISSNLVMRASIVASLAVAASRKKQFPKGHWIELLVEPLDWVTVVGRSDNLEDLL